MNTEQAITARFENMSLRSFLKETVSGVAVEVHSCGGFDPRRFRWQIIKIFAASAGKEGSQ